MKSRISCPEKKYDFNASNQLHLFEDDLSLKMRMYLIELSHPLQY